MACSAAATSEDRPVPPCPISQGNPGTDGTFSGFVTRLPREAETQRRETRGQTERFPVFAPGAPRTPPTRKAAIVTVSRYPRASGLTKKSENVPSVPGFPLPGSLHTRSSYPSSRMRSMIAPRMAAISSDESVRSGEPTVTPERHALRALRERRTRVLPHELNRLQQRAGETRDRRLQLARVLAQRSDHREVEGARRIPPDRRVLRPGRR